jgi:copper(I)-binding protein
MIQKLVSALIIGILFTVTAHAATIEIAKPWAKAQADTSTPGGIALTIVNSGGPDKLVSIKTPVARMAQLHNSKMKHGKMRMRRKTSLDVAAKANVELKMDGLHIMLMGLKSPLAAGSTFPVTLVFEKAGAIDVKVTVK